MYFDLTQKVHLSSERLEILDRTEKCGKAEAAWV